MLFRSQVADAVGGGFVNSLARPGDALYASNVARPGNQVNRNTIPTQSVSWTGDPILNPQGPAQPSFAFNISNFWAQGVNIGLSVRF